MAKSDYTASNRALVAQDNNEPRAQLVQMKSFLDSRIPHLARWASGRIKPEALVRFALLDMQQNPKLAACSRESIFLTLLACAAVGLEPGALRSECFAVPFAGKAQFMMGWRGFVKLARRSREVVGITSNVVFEGDEFDVDLGTANRIVHKPVRADGERRAIIGAYSFANLTNGHVELEYMDRHDLEKIRAIAEKRGTSPAWKDFPDQMCRKSCLRRLSKRLPLGDDYVIAQAIDDAPVTGKDQRDILDIVTDGEASRSEAQLARAPQVDAPPDDLAFDPGAVQ